MLMQIYFVSVQRSDDWILNYKAMYGEHKGLGLRKVLKKVLKKALKKILLKKGLKKVNALFWGLKKVLKNLTFQNVGSKNLLKKGAQKKYYSKK